MTQSKVVSFGRCPICGKDCRSDEEFVQLHCGNGGVVHDDCLRESEAKQPEERRAEGAGRW